MKNKGILRFLIILLVITLLITGGYLVYLLFYKPAVPPLPAGTPELEQLPPAPPIEALPPELHIPLYTVGEFGPDAQRMSYESGSMTLRIPALDLFLPVYSADLEEIYREGKNRGLDDTAIKRLFANSMDDVLEQGVALFNQAQLPGPENRNVSIAGHRDFRGKEFYYVDTLGQGDHFYLDYQDKTYVYLYRETFITDEDDWSPIAVSETSQLTLQSCHPILPADGQYDRIFVIAELIDIVENTHSASENLPNSPESGHPGAGEDARR